MLPCTPATVVRPATAPARARRLPGVVPTGWSVRVPDGRAALAGALAVAAAFPERIDALRVAVHGDVPAALAALQADLAAGGVAEDALPDVELSPVAEPDGAPDVAGLAEALALVAEYHRRPDVPAGDPGAVWAVAAERARATAAASVVILADGLEGAAEVAAVAPVVVVTSVPAVRRAAARLPGVTAVPRPPGPYHLPAGALVVLGERPDDLRLAASAGRDGVVVAGTVSPLVLAAYGLRSA
jgi:hypothetical protein